MRNPYRFGTGISSANHTGGTPFAATLTGLCSQENPALRRRDIAIQPLDYATMPSWHRLSVPTLTGAGTRTTQRRTGRQSRYRRCLCLAFRCRRATRRVNLGKFLNTQIAILSFCQAWPTVFSNDGAGNLTWATPQVRELGYWSRTGTSLSPTISGQRRHRDNTRN